MVPAPEPGPPDHAIRTHRRWPPATIASFDGERAPSWDGIMTALAAGHDAAMQLIDTSLVRLPSTEPALPAAELSTWGVRRVGSPPNPSRYGRQLGLTPGEAHDNRLCTSLLSGLRPHALLLADRGYDADWIGRLCACTSSRPSTAARRIGVSFQCGRSFDGDAEGPSGSPLEPNAAPCSDRGGPTPARIAENQLVCSRSS